MFGSDLVTALRYALEGFAHWAKRRAEAYDEDLLDKALKQEREAHARLIQAIKEHENPNKTELAYLASLERELHVYQAIRATALARFQRRAESVGGSL